MKTVHSTLSFSPAYPLESLAPLDKLLFLDIETTGFSASLSSIYLIGCIYYDKTLDSWKICQWFCESPEEESALLASFFAFLSPYTTLIHYNGNAFDLPFIRSRCQFYSLTCPLSGLESIDLYKKIRPWKAALSLTSLKQKSIEVSLKISRTVPHTGRQLIAAYQDYLSSKKTALCHLLLQHNQEDLQGLFLLLPLLAYENLPKASFSLIRQELIHQGDTLFLELLCQSSLTLPIPLTLNYPFAALHGQDTQMNCRLPMYQGELKYFYPDYKNYYYLPLEDMAIHKSVGSYVAKEARKKATPQTCYSKKTGLFFVQSANLIPPVFQTEYQGRPVYAEYHNPLFSEPQTLSTFLQPFFLLA